MEAEKELSGDGRGRDLVPLYPFTSVKTKQGESCEMNSSEKSFFGVKLQTGDTVADFRSS